MNHESSKSGSHQRHAVPTDPKVGREPEPRGTNDGSRPGWTSQGPPPTTSRYGWGVLRRALTSALADPALRRMLIEAGARALKSLVGARR